MRDAPYKPNACTDKPMPLRCGVWGVAVRAVLMGRFCRLMLGLAMLLEFSNKVARWARGKIATFSMAWLLILSMGAVRGAVARLISIVGAVVSKSWGIISADFSKFSLGFVVSVYRLRVVFCACSFAAMGCAMLAMGWLSCLLVACAILSLAVSYISLLVRCDSGWSWSISGVLFSLTAGMVIFC